jgi:hypothetical protein
VLEAATPAGATAPTGSGYGVIALVGGAVCLTTAALTWVVGSLGRTTSRPSAGVPSTEAVSRGRP